MVLWVVNPVLWNARRRRGWADRHCGRNGLGRAIWVSNCDWNCVVTRLHVGTWLDSERAVGIDLNPIRYLRAVRVSAGELGTCRWGSTVKVQRGGNFRGGAREHSDGIVDRFVGRGLPRGRRCGHVDSGRDRFLRTIWVRHNDRYGVLACGCALWRSEVQRTVRVDLYPIGCIRICSEGASCWREGAIGVQWCRN